LRLEQNTSTEQTAYLIGLVTKFQRLVSLSMNASHGADDAFKTNPGLCIAPAVMSRMKMFSDEMAKYGESYSFNSSGGDIAAASVDNHDAKTFVIRKEEDPEDLVDILHPQPMKLSPTGSQSALDLRLYLACASARSITWCIVPAMCLP
jgi:hypothetical protein